MKRTLLVALTLQLFATVAPAAEPEKESNEAAPETIASKWLDGLGDRGLVLNEVVEEGMFTVTHANSALGRITKFHFQQPGWWLSFSFHGELGPDTPMATLKEKFWQISLDRLPTPGLDIPGWEIRPQTPQSSFEKGFEVLSFGDGKIKIRVRTEFFALYGRDPSVLVPADAPSPPGSYFQIRKKFPLDLMIEAPFAFE